MQMLIPILSGTSGSDSNARTGARLLADIVRRRRRSRRSGPESWVLSLEFGGEGGIRTLEGLQTLAGFQDQCIQPLCHLSSYH